MSAAQTTAAAEKPAVTAAATPATATATAAVTGFGAIWAFLLILPVLFMIAFHVGAGYLSYQKFGSLPWAFVDFLFAYFYYPYYAFYLSAPAPAPVLFGGKRSVMNLLKMKWK